MQHMAPDSSYITWITTGVLAGLVIIIIIIAYIHYKKKYRRQNSEGR